MKEQNSNVKSLSNCFDVFVILLSTFSYRTKFHIIIITGCGVMTIFVYKGLTRNLEIGNTAI